jgi:hypothetical protein
MVFSCQPCFLLQWLNLEVSILFCYVFVIAILYAPQAVADDPSNSEWLVILAETIRRKRRDSPSSRSRRPDDEEYAFIDKAYSLAPENPFVLLGLMDCFVDCLRCKGSFKCGGVTYDYSNDTVVFMKKTCRYASNQAKVRCNLFYLV